MSPELKKWTRAETKRRQGFEKHVKEQLAHLIEAVDWLLKSAKLDEEHLDALEQPRRRHV